MDARPYFVHSRFHEVSAIIFDTTREKARPPAMQLAALLTQARTVRPHNRIALRDPIAQYGKRAIDGVAPWVGDRRLSAFAIRVIVCAGLQGERETGLRTLRAARRIVRDDTRADLEWAIGALQPPKLAAPHPAQAHRRSATPVTTIVRRYGG